MQVENASTIRFVIHVCVLTRVLTLFSFSLFIFPNGICFTMG